MSLQVVIGSSPEEVEYLTRLNVILEWLDEVMKASYNDGDFNPTIPFTREQLAEVQEWVDGIHTLLTDVNVFAGNTASTIV